MKICADCFDCKFVEVFWGVGQRILQLMEFGGRTVFLVIVWNISMIYVKPRHVF